ncbi:glycoside hydrolase family 26 protein [Desulforamulus ferrireducens]|uniref:glycoside hydrolase family 26 protein n=1 Tax=Desulforamulus ferrireducens TaxID=1833852 RepID=UPI001EE42378|nr:glycosyl hydrolase [Desulforamulus ferrireducens]
MKISLLGKTKKYLTVLFVSCVLYASAAFTGNVVTAQPAQTAPTILVDGKQTTTPDWQRDTKIIEYGQHYINTLKNYPDGYQIQYPSAMWLDVSLSPVRTTLADDNTRVEIYYQPLNTSPEAYVNYGNSPITTGKDKVQIIKNSSERVNGLLTRQLWWVRPQLNRVANDKNVYVSVDIIVNQREIYSLHFKSNSLEILNNLVPQMVNSFSVIPKQGRAVYSLPQSNERNFPLSEAAEELLNQYFKGEEQHWGIYEYSFPTEPQYLLNLEKQLDYTFDFVLYYSNLNKVPIKEILEQAHQYNRVVELTLQMIGSGEDFTRPKTYDILNGVYDQFLINYAKEVKAFGKPVLFRLNNEMNGDWCSYSAYHSSKDANLYVEVWRYIYKIFKEQGVDNALWVWNPHDTSFPDFKWNYPACYYPGDEYVDIIGLTGYNTGTYYPGEKWRGFTEIYDPLYQENMEMFPHKPFMITEFGTNHYGGNKNAWIKEAFAKMKNYPNIKVMIWWNGIDWDGQVPARTYRFDMNQADIKAVREGLQQYPKANKAE